MQPGVSGRNIEIRIFLTATTLLSENYRKTISRTYVTARIRNMAVEKR